MGYMRHHAIIVTGDMDYRPHEFIAARERAKTLFGPTLVSPIIDSPINGYRSFLIAPDGSKEGWEESDRGDGARDQFKEWLRRERIFLDWVEVQYGDDEGVAKIVAHSREALMSDTIPVRNEKPHTLDGERSEPFDGTGNAGSHE